MRRQRRRDADGDSVSKERRFETRVRQSIDQFAAGNRADDYEDAATTTTDASTTSSRVPSIWARRSSSSSSPSSVEGDNDDFFGVLGDKVNLDVHGSEVFLDSNSVNKRIN